MGKEYICMLSEVKLNHIYQGNCKRSQAKWREAGFETPPVTFQGLKQCDCNAGFKPGIVLDPFMGSGTTAKIAMEQNKNFIGIELNPEYIKLAEKRIAHVQVRLF